MKKIKIKIEHQNHLDIMKQIVQLFANKGYSITLDQAFCLASFNSWFFFGAELIIDITMDDFKGYWEEIE